MKTSTTGTIDFAHLQELARSGADGLRAALEEIDLRAARDPQLHARVAQLAESAGDVERAVLEYNLSLRDAPDQPEILRRLAEVRLDQGEVQRAIRCLHRLLELIPEDQETRERLIRCHVESGSREAALALLEEAGAGPRWAALRRELTNDAGPREIAPGSELVRGEELPEPSDGECITFAHAFAGREAVYARQWSSPTGKQGYTPVHEPFTPQVARRHLLGDFTVGIYAIRRDDTVRWIVLDVDIAPAELKRVRDGRALEQLRRTTHRVALQLVDVCAAEGLEPILEDSGNKGRHLWLLLAEPAPAAAAKRAGERLLESAGRLDPAVRVEVFPRQARVSREDGLGNLVKLPLGIHRVSGRRCHLLRPDGAPVLAPFELITRARRVERSRVLALSAAERRSPVPGPAQARLPADTVVDPMLAPAGPPSDIGTPAGPEGLTLVPDAPLYDLETDEEVRWLRSRCAVIANILEQADGTHVLSNDERSVMTYTMGHLTRGAEAVNAVLDRVLNVDKASYLKSPLRGHPTSCPKIRSRLPATCARVGCDCVFDVVASYPHPLLHLEGLRSRARLEADGASLSGPAIERLARDWLKARGDLERLVEIVRSLEAQLVGLVRERGSIETAAGRLSLHGERLAVEATPPTRPGAGAARADEPQAVESPRTWGAVHALGEEPARRGDT